jgi:hypothetical protein
METETKVGSASGNQQKFTHSNQPTNKPDFKESLQALKAVGE